jgi:hypothetical protein
MIAIEDDYGVLSKTGSLKLQYINLVIISQL